MTNEEKLAEVRARRAELDRQRAERDAARALEEQLEVETRALADAEAIAKAEDEHGPVGKRIALVRTDLGVIILKRPNPVLFRRFQDQGKFTHEAIDKLVRPSVVHPDGATFDRIMDELPATMIACANAVTVLAGARTEEASGK